MRLKSHVVKLKNSKLNTLIEGQFGIPRLSPMLNYFLGLARSQLMKRLVHILSLGQVINLVRPCSRTTCYSRKRILSQNIERHSEVKSRSGTQCQQALL